MYFTGEKYIQIQLLTQGPSDLVMSGLMWGPMKFADEDPKGYVESGAPGRGWGS